MHRSYKWIALVTCAVLIAFGGLSPLTTQRALAAPHLQGTGQKQIIYISSSGQLQATFWQQGSLTLQQPPAWTSGSFNGFNNLVTGDFNGDGKADIVTVTDRSIRAFYPANDTPGNLATNLVDTVDLAPGQHYNLLAAGRFMNSNRDQLAATYYYQDADNVYHEVLLVFNYRGNGIWDRNFVADFDYRLQSIAAGDVNRDSFADLTVLAKDNHKIQVRNGQSNFDTLLESLIYDPPENSYCCDWSDAAVGNIDRDNNDTDHPGNEIAMLRDSPVSAQHSTLLAWYENLNDPGNVDTLHTFEPSSYWFYPPFTDVALGDLNGDGDMEVAQLRNPNTGQVAYLSVLNPSGSGPDPIYEYRDNIYAWTQVAAGDINADGRDELVTLRSSGLRIYWNPLGNAVPIDPPGMNLWPTGLAIANLGLNLAPVLVVSPTSVNMTFSASQYLQPRTQTLQVINGTGQTAIAWNAGVDSTWLSLDKKGGQTPNSVQVTVNPRVAGIGLHTGYVIFTSSYGAATVPVSINVADPGFVVSPQRLSFFRQQPNVTTYPSARSIFVDRPAGAVPWDTAVISSGAFEEVQAAAAAGTLHWTAQGLLIGAAPVPTVDWLDLAPPSGTTPQTVVASVVGTAADAQGVSTSAIIGFFPRAPGLAPVYVRVDLYVTTNPIQLRNFPLIFR